MNPLKNIEKTGKVSDERLKEQFGSEMPFAVPDGYFETLPQRVLDATKKSENSARNFSIKRQNIYRIAAAAAILIFSTLFISLYFYTADEENEITSFDMEEIYLYNINQPSELDEAYLMSLVDEADASEYSSEYLNTELSDETIMEYLLAENHIEYLVINNY